MNIENENVLRMFGVAGLVGILSGAFGFIGILVGQAMNVWAAEFHRAPADVSKAGAVGGLIGFALAVALIAVGLIAERSRIGRKDES